MHEQGQDWRLRINYGALDMSATYAAVYSAMLPKAAQVVDPFHAVALANRALDAIRRRVQVEQLGHRGRKDDPLYRARRLLLRGEEHLGHEAAARLWSLLELGDPEAEVASAYRVMERLRDVYRETDPSAAEAMLADLRDHCLRTAMPPEIRRLGKTISTWFAKLVQLPPGADHERSHRVPQQPDQADQADRVRVSELRELPDQGTALRGQAELAGARLHRGPVTGHPIRIR